MICTDSEIAEGEKYISQTEFTVKARSMWVFIRKMKIADEDFILDAVNLETEDDTVRLSLENKANLETKISLKTKTEK